MSSKVKYSDGSSFHDITADELEGLRLYPKYGSDISKMSADGLYGTTAVPLQSDGETSANSTFTTWGAVLTLGNGTVGTPFQIAWEDGNSSGWWKGSLSDGKWYRMDSAVSSSTQPDPNDGAVVWVKP